MSLLIFTDLPEAHQAVVAQVCAKQNLQTEALSFKHLVNDEYEVLHNDKPTTYMLFFNTIEMD